MFSKYFPKEFVKSKKKGGENTKVMTKLFVGGIPYSYSNQQLQDLFAKFGTVSSAQIVMDKYTNQSKGFAFVEMSDDTEAQNAIKELNGFAIDGRKIGVSVARPREDNRSNGFSQNRDNFRRDGFKRGGNSFNRGGHRR